MNQQDFHAAAEPVDSDIDRSFALIMGAVLLGVALMPLVHGRPVRWWAVGAGAAIVAASRCCPVIIAPLRQVWIRFGMLMHTIMQPLLLGLVFFVGVTPVALVLRLASKDLLALRKRPDAASYWVVRQSERLSGDMSQQF